MTYPIINDSTEDEENLQNCVIFCEGREVKKVLLDYSVRDELKVPWNCNLFSWTLTGESWALQLEQAAGGIGLHVNTDKMEYMCFNLRGNISTLKSGLLKQVDKFTYLRSSVSSTETDINTWLAKAWTAIDRLSVIWKSDLTNKIKCSFYQAVVMLILLYGYTIWTLTKCMEKKLDSNYTRMLQAILNKSWRQHPTKQQTIKVRRTRYAERCWRSKDELISNILRGPLHIDEQRQGNQLEPIYNSYVLI